jgi:hypothetical protein
MDYNALTAWATLAAVLTALGVSIVPGIQYLREREMKKQYLKLRLFALLSPIQMHLEFYDESDRRYKPSAEDLLALSEMKELLPETIYLDKRLTDELAMIIWTLTLASRSTRGMNGSVAVGISKRIDNCLGMLFKKKRQSVGSESKRILDAASPRKGSKKVRKKPLVFYGRVASGRGRSIG